MTDKKSDDEEYRRYLGLTGIACVVIATPLCGYFIGYWIDRYFGTKPYASYLFLMLGIIACIREVYRIFNTFGKDD